MLVIIPVHVDTAESFAIPVDVNFLVLVAEALDEMVGMFFANVFDTKVINDETKTDGAPCVMPEAQGVVYRFVAIATEETHQLFFGKDAGLGKTIHSAVYLHIYFSIVDNVSEFVVHDDFFRGGVEGDEHVFVIIRWCAKIVVFNVQAEPTSTWGRECAVHKVF